MKPLVIRADAGAAMGTGHVMRCIALAQEWKRRSGRVIFAMKEHANLRERIEREGFDVTMIGDSLTGRKDAQATIECAKQFGASWIVVDGYDFDAPYQRALKEERHSVLSIDDNGHGAPFPADITLNQNCYAEEKLYGTSEERSSRSSDSTIAAVRDGWSLSRAESRGTVATGFSEVPYVNCPESMQLLLGCTYTLIRREFIDGRREREIPPVARCVLLTLGGGDPGELLHTVLRALDNLNAAIRIDVVVGGGFRNLDDLQKTISTMRSPTRLHVNTADMPELMAGADIAVSGGGSTNYEIAFMGLPALSIVMADNQRPLVEELERRGIVRNLGWRADLTEDRVAASVASLIRDHKGRARMSALGRELIDGKGAERVVDAMMRGTAP